jgi:hypothetical protein
MDSKEQVVNAIMESSYRYVSGVLDAVYSAAKNLATDTDYGSKIIGIELLKEIIDSAKNSSEQVVNG